MCDQSYIGCATSRKCKGADSYFAGLARSMTASAGRQGLSTAIATAVGDSREATRGLVKVGHFLHGDSEIPADG